MPIARTAISKTDLQSTLPGAPAGSVTAITINPNELTIRVGEKKSLYANGTYQNNSIKNVTAQATWASSDEDVATVDGGLVTAYKIGTATVTATIGSAVSDPIQVIVKSADILATDRKHGDGILEFGYLSDEPNTGVDRSQARGVAGSDYNPRALEKNTGRMRTGSAEQGQINSQVQSVAYPTIQSEPDEEPTEAADNDAANDDVTNGDNQAS